MRVLTVFFMSIIICIFGVLYVIFPTLWFNLHPWDSPLSWGGAIVLAAWWGSIRLLTAEAKVAKTNSGSGGAGLIVLAALGSGLILFLIA